jgi:hypothetical protein
MPPTWGNPINGGLFGAVLHDMPHNPLRDTISPSLARAAYAPKHATFTQSRGRKPQVNRAFNPVRYGHRPNVPGLANQINDRPVILPALKMSDIQFCCLFPAQSATPKGARAVPGLACPSAYSGPAPARAPLLGPW